MTGHEAVAIVKGLGISQREFARLIDVHPNAVSKWANGSPPSGGTSALLRLLKSRPELLNVLREIS